MNDEEIKGKILHKLSRRGNFKASHTSIDNLPKGFPNQMWIASFKTNFLW